VQAQLDVYNIFSGNTVIVQNNTFGSSWQRPLAFLAGRLDKFGFWVRFWQSECSSTSANSRGRVHSAPAKEEP
jgi:hypothetical protein